MDAKHRKLLLGDEVVLIYDVEVGFIKQSAVFKEYRIIQYNDIDHKIPVFQRLNSEITGLECFWIPALGATDEIIENTQKELIGLQVKVLELAKIEGINIPEKIKDDEIRKMAENNLNFRQALIDKIGYDPLDYSWVEKELAENETEKKWFQFQREHDTEFAGDWDQTAADFNKQFNIDILPFEAFNLAKKWKRYILGAWNTIRSQNLDIESWKTAAIKFEKVHRERDSRMELWSSKHEKDLPLAKVKIPVDFFPGPYYNACVERVPKLFTNTNCSLIRSGVVLKITSYDPKDRYISLDFTNDVRNIIKPGVLSKKVGEALIPDYVISVCPDDIEDRLEILGSLE